MSYEDFAYYYDSLMDEQFYEDYVTFINKHVLSYETVLELGCGTGEIASILAGQDKVVYATDLSKDMLEVARLKAIEKNVSVMLARIDMADFKIDQPVDLILCLCDSLNYLLSKKRVLSTFTNVYDSLKHSGTFIFDVDSMHKMNVVLKDYLEEQDDPDFYFKWSVQNIGSGEVIHKVKIIDKENNETVDEEHHQKTLEVKEYIELLSKAGFKDVTTYSDFNDYQDECERVIFVCRKD